MDTSPKPRTPGRDEIPELLAQQAASGLTIAAFAREHGLTTWKLYSAARAKAGAPSRRRARSDAASTFAPVSVIGGMHGFELDLGSRGILRIPSGFDPADLRQLLEVVRGC